MRCMKKLSLTALIVSLLLSLTGPGGRVQGAGSAPASQTAPAAWTLQGRVYEGPVGDETHPLPGVNVYAYGADDAYPDPGELIASTTTDADGWYGLEVSEGYEYYHIREADPEGHASLGATTVGGTVQDPDWIQYVAPLDGKVLTGNKFWDRPPVLSGRVYSGTVGVESAPLENVALELTCSGDAGALGELIDSARSDANGWYGLWAYGGCEFYNIVERDPAGMISAGASSVSGTVQSENWIQYAIPLHDQTLTGNKFWDRPAAAAPDLTVTDLWREGNAACYQMVNAGGAPAEAGHRTALFVDGTGVSEEIVEEELESDQPHEGCLEWACSGAEDAVEVRVDVEDAVAESDEDNNTRGETWACDVTPPQIVSDVSVEVGQEGATISWETDEASDSLVLYDGIAGRYGLEAGDTALSVSHVVALSDLEPATTYQGVVESRDAAGNTATSDGFLFETLPPAPGRPPSVALDAPATLTETVTITAAASGEAGVERVIFALGEEHLLTDYVPPYRVTVDTLAFENGGADLRARAVDVAGLEAEDAQPVTVQNLKDASSPEVEIAAPKQGDTVSGVVSVTAVLTDDTGIVSARFYVDGDYQQFEPFDVTNQPQEATVTYLWDTRGLTNSLSYRLAVQAFDKEGKVSLDTADVTVHNVALPPPPSPARLEVTNHTLTRVQNRFIVGLKVKNTGDYEARNVVIRDGMIGFQPMAMDASGVKYLPRYHPQGGYGYVEIASEGTIPPGGWDVFFYNVMPVMTYPATSKPEVGVFVDMAWSSAAYSGHHHFVTHPVGLTTGGETVSQAHANALRQADYLIVTNPYRLFQFYNPGLDRNKKYCDLLLSTMAELAYEKQGALGYIDTYSETALRNLITSGGSWSSRLKSGWASNGYLLLVGENQIVPGWSRYWGTRHTTKGDIPFTASPTDYPYASTSGTEPKPELSIGRIIGNTPALQMIAIRNSLYSYRGEAGYDYDGLLTFAVSGFPACMGGKCDNLDFEHEVSSISKVLSGSIVGMRTPDLAEYDAEGNILVGPTKHAITTTFFTHSADKDIVFLAGHGNAGTWDVFNVGDIQAQQAPFGTHSPFVFASSCGTGDYPAGFGFAESMLVRRAAAYMGAIEIGACNKDYTCPHADTFFSNWSTNESFALALKQTKQQLGTSFVDRWWNAIYHVFGDAKFGSLSGVAATAKATSTAPETPPDSVAIDVPAHEIVEAGGADAVEIPGGQPLLVDGKPLVPVYRAFYTYSGAHPAQDVRLVYRSEPIEVDGLDMPTTTFALPAADAVGGGAANPHEPAWWPDEAFSWSVEEGPTTTTLGITVYPFAYDRVTKRGRFYEAYEFEIDHVASAIAITRLETAEPSYEPGAAVRVDVEIEDPASEGRDLAVRGVIQQAGTGAMVDGMKLRMLKAVEGKAAYTAVWESTGFEPGSYQVMVDLVDREGTRWDTAERTFRLGESAGEITSFAVAPKRFDPGDSVDVSLAFTNTGTVPITGTLVVQIQDEGEDIVAEFTDSFAGVAPGTGASLEAIWDTTGVGAEDFMLVGYALYDGKSCEPVTVAVEAGRRVCLPLVMRQ